LCQKDDSKGHNEYWVTKHSFLHLIEVRCDGLYDAVKCKRLRAHPDRVHVSAKGTSHIEAVFASALLSRLIAKASVTTAL